MRKTILIILLSFTLLLGITGCRKLSSEELNSLQEKITDKAVKIQDEYNNLASCYVEGDVVVVELVNNSKEKQKEFKKLVIDSKYIEFRQGGPYVDHRYMLIASRNVNNYNNLKLKNYYSDDIRTIFFGNGIDEVYVYDNNSKEKVGLKDFLTKTYQNFDIGISEITSGLEQVSILKDGGTIIYKSKGQDITLIKCNTIDDNKDIYIGDYSMEFEQTYCKS